MEYICHIYRDPKDLLFWTFMGTHAVRLPLFDCFPKRIQKAELEGDFLLFYKEDRHSLGLIPIFPPKKITNEQLKIINQKWNECIENNLEQIEFDI